MKILAESLSRPRLSVAMIVRDEQDVLAASVESVGQIADEIVVLDTGSTDRTVERATQLGAKFTVLLGKTTSPRLEITASVS